MLLNRLEEELMGKVRFKIFLKKKNVNWNKDCATLREVLFQTPAKEVISGFTGNDPRFAENVTVAELAEILLEPARLKFEQLQQLFEKIGGMKKICQQRLQHWQRL